MMVGQGKMPESRVGGNLCGTHLTGYLTGGHPRVQDGVVDRKVCFEYTSSACQSSSMIKVVNCGHFFIYNLVDTPGCSFRYCTLDG